MSPSTDSENKENPQLPSADSGKVLQNPQPRRNKKDGQLWAPNTATGANGTITGQLTGQSMVAKARRELSYFSYSWAFARELEDARLGTSVGKIDSFPDMPALRVKVGLLYFTNDAIRELLPPKKWAHIGRSMDP